MKAERNITGSFHIGHATEVESQEPDNFGFTLEATIIKCT